ncbi:hypothetical protein SLS54_009035 [Diplodia seriata]
MVVKLEPLIKQNIIKLAKNVETWAGTGRPLKLVDSISCFATDVITEYCFGRSYGFLDDPTMQKSLYNAIHTGMDDIRSQVRKVKQDIDQGVVKPSESTRATVFTEILTSNMPDSEKDTERLSREAQAMVQAGIETVSWSLTTNLTYLLSNPHALARLHAELLAAIPPSPNSSPADLPSWTTLEQLPYLSACVLEGLRLGYGVVTRLARIPETETLVYTDEESHPSSKNYGRTWSIPPGTPVGMSAYIVHHDERVFKDSRAYRPERWLDAEGKRNNKKLEGCLLSFSKGSRQCVGMNLAHAELWLGLATWVRWFGDRLELAEGCGVEDVLYVVSFLLSYFSLSLVIRFASSG